MAKEQKAEKVVGKGGHSSPLMAERVEKDLLESVLLEKVLQVFLGKELTDQLQFLGNE